MKCFLKIIFRFGNSRVPNLFMDNICQLIYFDLILSLFVPLSYTPYLANVCYDITSIIQVLQGLLRSVQSIIN